MSGYKITRKHLETKGGVRAIYGGDPRFRRPYVVVELLDEEGNDIETLFSNLNLPKGIITTGEAKTILRGFGFKLPKDIHQQLTDFSSN